MSSVFVSGGTIKISNSFEKTELNPYVIGRNLIKYLE